MQQTFRRLFRQKFGKNPVSVLPLEGDGSARQIKTLIDPWIDKPRPAVHARP